MLQSDEFKHWFGEPQDANRTRDASTNRRGIGIQTKPTTIDTRGEGIGDAGHGQSNQYGGVIGSNEVSKRFNQSQDEQGIKGKPYTSNIAINDDGSPQLWFHGTAGDFNEFDLNHEHRNDTGWLGTGVYLTDKPKLAKIYANNKKARTKLPKQVMRLYTNANNFYEVTQETKDYLRTANDKDISDKFTNLVKSLGYDGVILNLGGDWGREIVVFNPEQVKFADGRNLIKQPKPEVKTEEVKQQTEQEIDKSSIPVSTTEPKQRVEADKTLWKELSKDYSGLEVLSNITDEDRLAHTSGDISTQHIAKGYFKQIVSKANPLTAIKDFISHIQTKENIQALYPDANERQVNQIVFALQ